MPLRSQHRAVWRRAAFLVLLCAALALVTTSQPLHAALLEVLASSKAVIIDYPLQGALLFVLLAAVSAMFAFVSIAILVPVAVYAWGGPLSMLMLWLGWILGGIAAYVIARFLGRPVVQWMMADSALQRLERRIHPGTPLGLIVLLQLGLPSEIPGYLLGFARYPPGKFLVALAVGELPYTVATVWLGAGFVTARSGVVLAVGLAVAALSVGAFHLLRGRLRVYGDSNGSSAAIRRSTSGREV